MKRRTFITGLGGAAAWPLAAGAQKLAMPVIGLLCSGTPGQLFAPLVASFMQALKEAGFNEGQNLIVEQRWANNQYDRLPEMAANLVRARVSLIVAIGNNLPAQAAKAATSTIPIVFFMGVDPVALGLVDSLNRALFAFELEHLIRLAAQYAVPVIYGFAGSVRTGGVMSYSVDNGDLLRQAGLYAGRILKGEKPADLPVVQPTKFTLAINLNTAKALGLTVPETLLAIADEVVE